MALIAGACDERASAVTLSYVGTDNDLTNLFPGGGPANTAAYVVVPWRSDYHLKPLDGDNNNVYGSDGYALFGTRFDYPNANAQGGNAFVNPTDNSIFPNIINLPSYVSGSQILSTRKAGGWAYSLIDDPQLTNGARDWAWGDSQTPASTGQAPYVKMGFLDGGDIFGNIPEEEPTGRWAFTVGENAPAAFRLGVMTGGGDNENFVPAEIYLQQFNGTTPVGTPLGSGALTGTLKDRFVDMHFFDIVGAQPGDTFAIGVMSGPGSFGNSGVAGFSFDVLTNVSVDNADFDGSGAVDGADFLIWQRGFGGSGGLPQGDANNSGTVDSADLAIWKTQFGTGAAFVAAGAVPEPTSAVLLLLTLCGAARLRK